MRVVRTSYGKTGGALNVCFERDERGTWHRALCQASMKSYIQSVSRKPKGDTEASQKIITYDVIWSDGSAKRNKTMKRKQKIRPSYPCLFDAIALSSLRYLFRRWRKYSRGISIMKKIPNWFWLWDKIVFWINDHFTRIFIATLRSGDFRPFCYLRRLWHHFSLCFFFPLRGQTTFSASAVCRDNLGSRVVHISYFRRFPRARVATLKKNLPPGLYIRHGPCISRPENWKRATLAHYVHGVLYANIYL